LEQQNVIIEPFRYPNKIFNGLQWLVSWPKWDRLVEADVFFVPNPRLLPLSAGVPMVVVAHDLSFELFPEFLTFRRKLWHKIMRPAHIMHRTRRVIAVSEHTKRDLVRLYRIPDSKIQVMYSGIADYMRPVPDADKERVRMAYQLPARYILFLGAHEPRKNIPGLIEAFGQVASRLPHGLVIAGEAGWYEEVIQEAIHKSGVAERIFLIGKVGEEDKAAMYSGADVFVYPSFYEGFGFPPLEALACGTPIITSFNASLPEIVGRWAHLIDPYDISQMAAVIQEVLEGKERVMPQTSQEVIAAYNWHMTAAKVANILEKAGL
ncbi:MAG: glycosyltransferase family 4 protein, partial [Candidatus Binatia bacterium]